MNTDNKLIESILQSGKEQALQIENEAKENAERILAKGREDAEASKKEIEKAAERSADKLRHSAQSNAALLSRNAVLQTKRNEINKTLSGICDYIAALDDAPYFEFLYKMTESLRGENGEIILNERDKSRLPSDFEKKMNEAGINCTLSEEVADIPCGFILKNGDIETSLAIDALIEEKRNELEDFINGLLFAEED